MDTCSINAYEWGKTEVTQQMIDDYNENGFVLIRKLFDDEEMTKIKDHLEKSEEIKKHSYGLSDGANHESKLCIWNYAGNDISGMIARSEKMATTLEKLMGGDELYHYHTKLMMKEAFTGGAHVWHQDYGYWYKNGCLTPEMGSIFIAIDKCVKENSCLQVLKASHKLGRIDHCHVGSQVGADPERLQQILKSNKYDLLFVEMEPGDALFFDCNLLHTSGQNKSKLRRWVLICSYNKKKNNPYKPHHHALYHPLQKVPDSAIKECNRYVSTEEKWFMEKTEDKSVKS